MAKKLFSKGKGGKFDRWLIGGIVIAIVIIGLILWGPLRKFKPAEVKKPVPQEAKKEEPAAPRKQEKTEKKAVKKRVLAKEQSDREPKKHAESLVAGSVEKTVMIAIVIDDLGMDVKQAREVLSLPAKITFAVMPGLPQSRKVAEMATQNNRDVLLHLPMEYRGKNGKPAPGMLRSDMTPMEFLTTVSDDVASVPGAIGINNHEGSLLTENKEAMKFLMAELKARNLMFLDSLTSPKSVAYATAKEFGLKSARRDVFLDNNSNDPASIQKQLDELVEIAYKNGKAVGIGHPHPATISELRKWLVETDSHGVKIVPMSQLMQ